MLHQTDGNFDRPIGSSRRLSYFKEKAEEMKVVKIDNRHERRYSTCWRNKREAMAGVEGKVSSQQKNNCLERSGPSDIVASWLSHRPRRRSIGEAPVSRNNFKDASECASRAATKAYINQGALAGVRRSRRNRFMIVVFDIIERRESVLGSL